MISLFHFFIIIIIIDDIRYFDSIFQPTLTPFFRYRAMADMSYKIYNISQSLENAPRWAEVKSSWPEHNEGPIVTSGNVCSIFYML